MSEVRHAIQRGSWKQSGGERHGKLHRLRREARNTWNVCPAEARQRGAIMDVVWRTVACLARAGRGAARRNGGVEMTTLTTNNKLERPKFQQGPRLAAEWSSWSAAQQDR